MKDTFIGFSIFDKKDKDPEVPKKKVGRPGIDYLLRTCICCNKTFTTVRNMRIHYDSLKSKILIEKMRNK